MESSKIHAENWAIDLTGRLDSIKKNFEDYKDISDKDIISKQITIDSLSGIISTLNKDISSKDDNIQDQGFSFQLEKVRLARESSEKDKEIRDLTREAKTLKIQVDDLTNKLEDASSNRKFPFGQVKQLERKIQTRDTQISELNLKLENVQVKYDSLISKTNELSIEIERLKGILNSQDTQLDHE